MELTPEDVTEMEGRLRSYLAAFERGDPEAYADQFVFPACILADGRWVGIGTREECLEMCRTWTREAREDGSHGGETREMQVTPLVDGAAMIHLRYQRLRADGSALAQISAHYLMLEVGDTWKIATIVGEAKPAG